MKSPVTHVSVMLPSGGRVSLSLTRENKEWEVIGLRFGPLVMTREEAHAMQDLLNIVYPPE